jgi:hypothetical protein
MQPNAADRDDCRTDAPAANSAADDTALGDAFDLWRDLGGSD